MTETASELQAAIDKCVTDKTFSLDALQAIQSVKDKAARLERDLERSKEEIDDKIKEAGRANQACQEASRRVAELENRIKKMEADARAGLDAKAHASKCEAVMNAYQHCFETVFRPSVTREAIQRTVPVQSYYTDGMGNPMGQVDYYRSEEVISKSEE